MIAALCTFLVLLAAHILGQYSQALPPPSPCPTVFTYDPHGTEPGWWSGAVNISTDTLLHSLWLDIVLDTEAYQLLVRNPNNIFLSQHMMADVETEDFKIFRIENEDTEIQPGIPTSLRFFVLYDTNGEVPRLQSIGLNGIVICNALLAEKQTDSRLKTNINSNMKPKIKSRLSMVRPDNNSDPRNISNTGNKLSGRLSSGPGQEQTQCGTSTLKSQWPWVVAVYLRLYGTINHKYNCGGSLLSHRHVITAARCLYEASSEPIRLTNDAVMVYLGQQDLRTSILGVQIRLVQETIIAPDYTFDMGNNLALLVLNEPVTYTDWVRPVCLQPANEIYLDSIIGKKGWVVGFGYNAAGYLLEQLSEVEIPVISYETCLKSKDYSADIEINKYYCAGDRKDFRACNNRQGNGMYFKMGSSWYLRGQFYYIRFTTANTCDPTRYFGFTNVSQSISWINSIISNDI